MTQNKMENVPGKYKFESQENFDEFLKAQGKIPFLYNTYYVQVKKIDFRSWYAKKEGHS